MVATELLLLFQVILFIMEEEVEQVVLDVHRCNLLLTTQLVEEV